MKVALADIDEQKLIETSKKCSEILGGNNVLTVTTDVSKLDQVVRLRDRVYEAWGEVISSFILRSYHTAFLHSPFIFGFLVLPPSGSTY